MTREELAKPSGDVADLIENGDAAEALKMLRNLPSTEGPLVITRLDPGLQVQAIELLEPDEAAWVHI